MGHILHDNAPHSPFFCLCVASPPRYQVDVSVRDRLTSGFSAVRSDVETGDSPVFNL